MTKYLLGLLAALSVAGGATAGDSTRYLAFQIFTASFDSHQMRQAFPPPPEDLRRTVLELRERIGTPAADGRRIGFVLGPIALDNPDEEVRGRIAEGFTLALEAGVAVGFHIDDSMFWGRLGELNTPDNLEWLDWKGTVNTGRRLDWSSKPLKVMPQLCFNSKGVRKAVADRAALIGREIGKGVARLRAAHREDLFLGVIAGWETQIGRDFDTGKSLGYRALVNAGYSAAHPPADIDRARSKVVHEFVELWARSLVEAGVPRGKVYSHIAFQSETAYRLGRRVHSPGAAGPYLEAIHFTPPATAFCDSCLPGLSTYPQPGLLEQWRAELEKHGNPPWASCEGTALDPAQAKRGGKGMNMEGYLGNLFNHGAVFVNVFGWGVGGPDNPFRKAAEGASAVAAYKKFLRGEKLREAPIPVPVLPPEGLEAKVHRVQAELPRWVEKHGPAKVKANVEKLDKALKEKRFEDAAAAADAILKTIESEPR